MAIGDLTAKATVVFEAETKELRAAIKTLEGDEKRLAEAQLKQANARNDQLDVWTKRLGTATAAIGVAAAAGAAMWAGMEHNARRAQLQQNTYVLDVEKLRKGLGGLRTEMQALETANAIQRGTFKLTGTQMEMVGKAMRQLVREGNDWEEVTKKVGDAFTKLNGGGLDDFGIHVKDAKTDSEKFNAILDAMAAKAGKVGDATKTSAEEMQGMRVRFADVMDRVKQALGDIGMAFLPIVEALASVAGYVADIVNKIPGGAKSIGSVAKYGIPFYGQALALRDMSGDATHLINSGGRFPGGPSAQAPDLDLSTNATGEFATDPGFNLAGLLAGGVTDVNQLAYLLNEKAGAKLEKTAKRYKKIVEARKAANERYKELIKTVANDILISGQGSYARTADHVVGPWAFDDSPATFDALSQQPQIDSSLFEKYAPGGAHDAQAYNQFQRGQQQSRLEGIFGPLSEFDAYKTAFETLNGAVGSAFGAWIDGSASAGQAFKKFIGEALKGVAVQMAMEAIKHAAYAVGSLAFGDFRGAATHGKAAAAFAAGAIAVGGAAKALHSGGSSAGGGGGGGGSVAPGGGVPAYGGGGNDDRGGTTRVVVFGQDFTNDTARMRQQRAAKVLEDARQAEGNSAVRYA